MTNNTHDELFEKISSFLAQQAHDFLLNEAIQKAVQTATHNHQPTLTLDDLIHTMETLPQALHTDIYFTDHAYEEIRVKRTWRERIFTRPWNPPLKYRIEHKPAIFLARIPSPLTLRDTTIICAHPVFKDAIETATNVIKEPAE